MADPIDNNDVLDGEFRAALRSTILATTQAINASIIQTQDALAKLQVQYVGNQLGKDMTEQAGKSIVVSAENKPDADVETDTSSSQG